MYSQGSETKLASPLKQAIFLSILWYHRKDTMDYINTLSIAGQFKGVRNHLSCAVVMVPGSPDLGKGEFGILDMGQRHVGR